MVATTLVSLFAGRAKSISDEEMKKAIERLQDDLRRKFPNVGFAVKSGTTIQPFTLRKTFAIHPKIVDTGNSWMFSLSLGDYYDKEKMPTEEEVAAVVKYIDHTYMKRRGWYVSNHNVSGGKLVLEIMPEGANRLTDVPATVYHLTDTQNVPKISSQGLKPKGSDDPDRKYTARVYVFTSLDLLEEQIKQNIDAHEDSFSWHPKLTKTLDMSVVEIDTSKLRQGTKFYRDPEFSGNEGAYYTYTHIPPEAIVAIKKV